MSDLFLARYADCIFWMSRYLERAESLARLLDVTYSFSAASSDAQNWNSLLTIYYDEEIFKERYKEITASNVIHFYFDDDSHGNSIYSCVSQARINARQLRPIISNEMWMHINTLYNNIKQVVEDNIRPQDLWHVLADIRKKCQMINGSAEGGLYRDQGWYFYLIGRNIERSDQTTRLLDIKYHLLLPSMQAVGSVLDRSQWFSLLHAAGGYYAFRREYPYVVNPSTVAGFLLLDRRFPRSVAASIKTMGWSLKKLYWQCGLEDMKEIIELNEQLSQKLKEDDIKGIIQGGLHEYLDNVQIHLSQMADHVATHFFA